MVKKVLVIALAVIVGMVAIGTVSYIAGHKSGTAESDQRNEDRLRELGDINTSLAAENTELKGINQTLSSGNARNAERLRAAEEYLGGIGVELAEANSIVQRLVIRVQYFEEAVRIIFEDNQDR